MNNLNKKQFVCLSGLPRTGSTLLCAILSQNPKIHTEGISAVCRLIWDTYMSCIMWSIESIQASNREKIIYDFVSSVPNIYYKYISEEETIIVDKNRNWTKETNVSLLKTFIDSDIKIIVLTRPLEEIMKSFAKLSKKNGKDFDASIYLKSLNSALKGLKWAKENNENNTFLFIEYKEIVENPEKIIEKIYDFCGWESFTHSFDDIKMKNPENDEVYEIPGLHTIRSKIDIEENDVELSQEVLDIINSLKNEYEVD